MLQVNLSDLKSEPDYRGSVQDLFRQRVGGHDCLICRTSKSGSVFDVGTIFSVPGSDVTRTAVRHDFFNDLMDPAAWGSLESADLEACLGSGGYGQLVEESGLLERFGAVGVSTHHLGLIDTISGEVLTSGFPPSPSNLVLVREYPVYKPEKFMLLGHQAWDYTRFFKAGVKMSGLEHVFRLGSPGGSSLLKRYDKALKEGGNKAGEAMLRELGLDVEPAPWRRFNRLLYDCTSKYESHDRYLGWQETVHLSGLGAEKFREAVATLALCTVMAYSFFRKRGFELWDLKWEMAVDRSELVIVDTLDPDSIRLTARHSAKGTTFFIHFNKQAIRDYFRILHPDWIRALNECRDLCGSDPQGRGFVEIYRDGVEAGKYPDVPEIEGEFVELQARKYELVAGRTRDGKVLRPTPADVEAVMEREIGYYEKNDKLDEFARLNS